MIKCAKEILPVWSFRGEKPRARPLLDDDDDDDEVFGFCDEYIIYFPRDSLSRKRYAMMSEIIYTDVASLGESKVCVAFILICSSVSSPACLQFARFPQRARVFSLVFCRVFAGDPTVARASKIALDGDGIEKWSRRSAIAGGANERKATAHGMASVSYSCLLVEIARDIRVFISSLSLSTNLS